MKRLLVLFLAFAVTAAMGQKVTLSMKYKKGESLQYKETMSQQMTAEGMPGGGQSMKNIRYSTMAVSNVSGDGSAEIIRSTDSSTSFMNDKPAPNPQFAAMEGLKFKVTMDKTGKVLDAATVEEPTDDMAKRMAAAMINQFKANPGLPAKSVAVGETWNDEIVNNQDTPTGKLTVTMKMTTKFSGVEKMNGADVAILDVTGTLAGELGAGMGTITGTVKGKRWFAHKQGRELKSEMNIDQNMDMQTPQGNMLMQVKTQQTKELVR